MTPAQPSTVFATAFSELTGYPPYPWQARLYSCLHNGELPKRCGIPTAAGKTNSIAVWLIALWRDNDDPKAGTGTIVPRRLVYVVDRRTVVDQATAEVERMRSRLLTAKPDSSLGLMRRALQRASAAPDEAGVTISTLRGQHADNHEWDHDASRPAIIVGTVDMIGSRLLFSGYGLGRSRKSLHPGLLGQDSLIILDEAQLSPALAQTLFSLREHVQRTNSIRPSHVMLLTATQPTFRTTATNGVADIQIDADDLAVDDLRRRIQAPKELQFGSLEDGESMHERMAAEAVQLAGSNRLVVIYANTVELVNRINTTLGDEHKIPVSQRLTLTGEMRGFERDRFLASGAFRTWQTRANAREPISAAHFLITTAAGEVGVNYDADDAVCDLVPLERMVQRIGRVNRFGDSAATVRLCLPMTTADMRAHHEVLEALITQLPTVESDEKKKVEKRIAQMERTLTRYASRTYQQLKQTYSASPETLDAICREDGAAEAYTPSSPPPLLDRARLDDWSLTSLRPKDFPRPQVSYWLRGLAPDDTITTQFAWREDLRFAVDEDDAAAMTQAIPLRPAEIAQVAIYRAAKLLTSIAEKHPDAIAAMLDAAGDWTAFSLSDLLDVRDVERFIAFSTIVLPAHAGGLKAGLPDVESTEPVSDQVDRARYLRFRIAYAADEWIAHDLFAIEDAEAIAAGETLKKLVTNLAAGRYGIKRIHISGPDNPESHTARIVYFGTPGAETGIEGAADIASLTRVDVPLGDHNELAGRYARTMVERLALSASLAEAIVLAAERHDTGKDRPQWQRAVGNNSEITLAKSACPGFDKSATNGYRHEFGSMLDAARDSVIQVHPERELILHLIAAHHGHGRPGFNANAYDPQALASECKRTAAEAEERFVRLQSRFGWWQLAYLEGLIKSVDALASAQGEQS